MTNNYHLPFSYLFKRQFQHILFLLCMVPGALYIAEPSFEGHVYLGRPDGWWFHLLIVIAVAHQVIVWFVFRTQLVYSLLTRLFGRYDMVIWAIVFLPFLIARPVLVVILGMVDTGSLPGNPMVHTALGAVLAVPAIYAGISVQRYFGIPRAIGGDHFRKIYREMPMVNKGAFKYTSNAMYLLVFLGLWSIALFFGSRLALAAAIFQHAYIWVHMFCTEEPDMQVIYRKRQ